jgi:hypothetical protein
MRVSDAREAIDALDHLRHKNLILFQCFLVLPVKMTQKLNSLGKGFVTLRKPVETFIDRHSVTSISSKAKAQFASGRTTQLAVQADAASPLVKKTPTRWHAAPVFPRFPKSTRDVAHQGA